MKFNPEQLAKISNGEDLADVFTELLDDGNPNYIDDLAHLCTMGGWPNEDTDPVYNIKATRKLEGSIFEVTVEVFFDEKVFGGGCPDMPTIKPRNGDVSIEIDIRDGEITWLGEN